MAPLSCFVMTGGFWQSLKLDLHIYIAISLMHGDRIMAVLQLMFCVNMSACGQTGAHRQVGWHVLFGRFKEVMLCKGWNMLHNVYIYWPHRFLYELFCNIMINNIKKILVLLAKCLNVLYVILTASADHFSKQH